MNESLGNVFVIDRTASLGSYLKYVNFHPTNSINFPGPNVGPRVPANYLLPMRQSRLSGIRFVFPVVMRLSPRPLLNVTCYDRTSGAGLTKTIQIGSYPGDTVKGGMQVKSEDEGVASEEVLLAQPHGLAFDSPGSIRK